MAKHFFRSKRTQKFETTIKHKLMSEDEKILISVQWLRMWKSFHADESSKQKHKIELSELFAAKAQGVKNCWKVLLWIGVVVC